MYANIATVTEPTPQLQLYVPPEQKFNFNFFDRYVDYVDRKDTTVKSYLSYLRHFAKWLESNGIFAPTREDIKAYRAYLEQSDLSAGTVAQYLRSVRSFFKWTSSEGLWPDVAANIHGPTIRHDVHKRDALDREGVPKVAASIDRSDETGKRDFAMYMICVTCGTRCVELSRANVGDLKIEGGKMYLYVQGKGHDDADAPVLIIPPVREALEDYLKARTSKPTAKSPLFTSTSNRNKGGRIAASTISAELKSVLVNAGYVSTRLTPHSLRHSSATAVYRTTHDPEQVRQHQRHADISTSQIYIHDDERETRETEQLVYNYYFADDDRLTVQKEAEGLLAELDEDQLQEVVSFIKSLKKGGTQ